MDSAQSSSHEFSEWIHFPEDDNGTYDEATAGAFPPYVPVSTSGQNTHNPSLLSPTLPRIPADGPVMASALQATAAEWYNQSYPYEPESTEQHSILPEELLQAPAFPALGLSAMWTHLDDVTTGRASYPHSLWQMIPSGEAAEEQRADEGTINFNVPTVTQLGEPSRSFAVPGFQGCAAFANPWGHPASVPPIETEQNQFSNMSPTLLQCAGAPVTAPVNLPPAEYGEEYSEFQHKSSASLNVTLPMTPMSLGGSPQEATDGTYTASPVTSPSTTKRKRLTQGPYVLVPSARPTKRNRPVYPTLPNLTAEERVELEGIRSAIRSSAFLTTPQSVEPILGQSGAEGIVSAGSKFGRRGASIYSALFSQVDKRSYICYDCGFAEKRFQRAIRHQRQEHFEHFPFECEGGDGHPPCGVLFASEEYMTDHVKKSVQQHVCEACSKSFPNKGNLTRHQKSCHGSN